MNPSRTGTMLTAAALVAACSAAVSAQELAAGIPRAARDVQEVYAGARVLVESGRVRGVYGVPMTPGLTPRAAAEAFWAQHGDAFGIGQPTLVELWSTPVRNGRFTVFGYGQRIDGVPVEHALARVLVLNAPVPRVVYAGANLAARPAGGFPRAVLEGPAAVALVQRMVPYRDLKGWTRPELVVFFGEYGEQAPGLAWKFGATGADPRVALTFFVDAATGQLRHVRDEVQYTDVSGSVRGNATPGTLPDIATNPPVLMPLPDIRAFISGGNSAYTDGSGNFVIAHPGTAAVTVGTGVNSGSGGGGRWSNVVPTGVAALTASLNVVPPGPADLILNPSPAEQLTAQVNAFRCATLTHNYFKSRAPSFTALDIAITTNTGVSGTCNAFYSSANQSINFYNAGGGCVNTAYSSVVSHEYGHFIVNRLGLAQNAFGEGYGDVCGMLVWDDGIVGRNFRTDGTHVRNPLAANIQYPCATTQCSNLQIHCCGQILGGVWWRIRLNMGTFYGSQVGLDETRDLHVAWSLITQGGLSTSNSAGPRTAVEVLTVDDDDGNLGNGTPNYSRICAAFAAHSIECPPLQVLAFEYPSGRPAMSSPTQGVLFPVNVVGVNGTPEAGSGAISYRVGTSGSFTTVPMTQTAPNQYVATLPAAACLSTIQFYVSARDTTGATYTDPSSAPSATFSATSAAALTTVADLNFETDPGWTVTNDPSLTTGAWERAVPVTPAPTNCPSRDYDGVPPSGTPGRCWVTDNRSGNFDVDGGPTILTSTPYDLSAFDEAEVSYARWIVSTNGVTDSLRVEVSGNNGGTWTPVEVVPSTSGWNVRTFRVSSFVPLSSQFRVRWSVADNPNDSVTEAGVDAFRVLGYTCTSACYPNCDGSTTAPVLNVADFTCFLTRFAEGQALPPAQQVTHYTNCDGSTTAPVLNVADFTCFLTRFAAGCP